MRRKYRFKRKPRPFQVKALKKLLIHNGGAVFAPMRTGKSKIAVDFAGCHHVKHGTRRVLIVAPLSAMAGWRDTIRKDCNVPWVMEDAVGNIVDCLPKVYVGDDWQVPEGSKPVTFRLINYERVYGREPDGEGGYLTVDNKSLHEYDPELIIIDESHRVGDPTTVVNRKLYRLVRHRGTPVVLLTGTPFHRKPFYIFGQWKLRDDAVFGTNFGHFKNQIARFYGYGNYQYKFKKKELAAVRKKIAPETFFMKHVPPREPNFVHVKFPLVESANLYREVASEGFARVGRKGVIECENPLAKHVKLAQMTGGKVKIDDGPRAGSLVRIGREKERVFKDLVGDMVDGQITKFVVGAHFLYELAAAGRICKEAGYRVLLYHGGVSDEDRERRILEFEEAEDPTVFISQIAAGSLGVDLSAADTMVLWSLSRSLVDYDQFLARIRKYKDKRALTYYFLLAEGTVDEINLLALRQGKDLADFVTDHPELLAYREVA